MRQIWPVLFIGAMIFFMGCYADLIDYIQGYKGTNIPFSIYQSITAGAAVGAIVFMAKDWNKRSQIKNTVWVVGAGFAFTVLYLMATVF